MSRSYREPWLVEGYGTKGKKWRKRYANKRVRQTKHVPDYKAYRKLTDPWEICDYKFRYDPKPRIWHYGGEIRILEPDLRWKAVRK